MLKKNAIKRITFTTLAVLIILITYFFPTIRENKIDTKTEYINTLKTPIYLIDKNNYVARVNILKKSNNLDLSIKETIKNLTISKDNENYLPNNFKAMIPENTKLLDYSLDKGLLKLNFSEELLNCPKDYQEKMLETITYSLTEIKEITKIMIFVNGERLLKFPESTIILPVEFDRTYGINKVYDISSIKNINQITTYYIASTDNYDYYVPISNMVNTEDKIKIIIKNLKTSPINQTNLISYLASSTNLENYEILENAISLSFDNDLIANIKDKNILEEVKYSIFLSLKDTYHIERVIFELPNKNFSIIN